MAPGKVDDQAAATWVLEAVRDAGELTIDFKKLAAATNIADSSNATHKLQGFLKRFGMKYDKNGGGFVNLADDGAKGGDETKIDGGKKRKRATKNENEEDEVEAAARDEDVTKNSKAKASKKTKI